MEFKRKLNDAERVYVSDYPQQLGKRSRNLILLWLFLLETSLLGFQSSLAPLPLQLRQQERGMGKNAGGNFQITNYFLPNTRTVFPARFRLVSGHMASWIN